MKVYTVFFCSQNVKYNPELGKNIGSETIQIDGVYTTEEGAKNKVQKIEEMGFDGYYISQSLKGDLVELVRKDSENHLKKEGKLRQNLSLKTLKRKVKDSYERVDEEDEILIKFEVVKRGK